MKTKKYLPFLILPSLIVLFSCNKKDNEVNPTVVHTDNFLKTETYFEVGHGIEKYDYSYDNEGRLRKTYENDMAYAEYIYNDNGTLKEIHDLDNSSLGSYFYEQNRLSKIINKKTPYNDTTYFTYNNAGLVIQSLNIRNESYSNELSTISEFAYYFYNNDNTLKSKAILSQYSGSDGYGQSTSYDSIFYIWNVTGNLAKEVHHYRYFGSETPNIRTIEYTYDNKTNYFWTIHYPSEVLFIISLSPDEWAMKNNLTSKKESDEWGTNEKYYSLDYNEIDLPIRIDADWGNIQLEYIE